MKKLINFLPIPFSKLIWAHWPLFKELLKLIWLYMGLLTASQLLLLLLCLLEIVPYDVLTQDEGLPTAEDLVRAQEVTQAEGLSTADGVAKTDWARVTVTILKVVIGGVLICGAAAIIYCLTREGPPPLPADFPNKEYWDTIFVEDPLPPVVMTPEEIAAAEVAAQADALRVKEIVADSLIAKESLVEALLSDEPLAPYPDKKLDEPESSTAPGPGR